MMGVRMRKLGNYYATATALRGDGRKFGLDAATQAKTKAEARDLTEATIAASPSANGKAYISRWNQQEQRREIVAERDEAGNWWHFDIGTRTLTAWN